MKLHPKATRTFCEAHQGERLHHAWALIGAEGLGKKDWALAAASQVLCPDMDADLAAKRIAQGSNPDAILLETRALKEMSKKAAPGSAESKTESRAGNRAGISVIDSIRNLKSSLSHKVQENHKRVVIINSLDELSRQATATLLKLIEEPPLGVIFMLIIHREAAVPPTILSRSIKLNFFALDLANFVESYLAEELKKTLAPDEIESLWQWTQGRLALAKNIEPNLLTRLGDLLECVYAPRYDRLKIMNIIDQMHQDKQISLGLNLISSGYACAVRKLFTGSGSPPEQIKPLVERQANQESVISTFDKVQDTLHKATFSTLHFNDQSLMLDMTSRLWRTVHA